MKRNLLVLSALCLVFVSANAFGAATSVDCPSCKSTLRHVPVPSAQTSCSPFDFDGDEAGMSTPSPLGQHWGYCNASLTGGVNENDTNHRAIFRVCDCITKTPSLASKFAAGRRVGIRMSIQTPGVYWSNPTHTVIRMDTYPDSSTQPWCTDTSYDAATTVGSPAVASMGFGTIAYYQDALATVSATPTPDCAVQAATYRATTLQSFPLINNGYQVTTADDVSNRSVWAIGIPQMRVTSSAPVGQTVKVKIELLDTSDSGGICGACVPLCECIIEVAILGCPTGGEVLSASCIRFPYVIADSTWTTGIAITNLDTAGTVASPKLTLTLTDENGKVFKTEKAMTKKMEVFTLMDALGLGAAGKGLTWTPAVTNTNKPSTSAWLLIESNTAIDGYQFVTDGNFGGSTSPRLGCK